MPIDRLNVMYTHRAMRGVEYYNCFACVRSAKLLEDAESS